MRILRSIVLILTACILLTIIASGATGSSLSPSTPQGTIDVADREVNRGGASATITSISLIDDNTQSTAVEVVGSKEQSYLEIQIRDPDSKIISSSIRLDIANNSVQTFDSSAFYSVSNNSKSAGTYLILMKENGNIVDAHPVVVQAYNISVTGSSTVGSSETTNITADISEREIPKHSNAKSIELTIADDNINIQKEKSMKNGKREYTFEINTNKLEMQEYNSYVMIRGDEKVLERDELLAIGQGPELTVTDSGGTGGSGGDDGTGGSGGDDGTGGSGGDDGTGGSGGDNGSNNTNETDETNETTASNITISNVSLEPDTVGNDQDEHTLSFDVSNVSTDGNADKLSISIPERVTIENVEDVRINNSEYDPNATPTNNTIEFSVNPSNATHPENLSIQLDLRLST